MNGGPLHIRLIHCLPGRLRVRLSVAPVQPDDMERAVQSHPGIHAVRYTAPTRTMLLSFDPAQTSQEELLVRMAVYLSLEHDQLPVRVYADVDMHDISATALFAGFLITAALGSRVVPRLASARTALDWAAGAGTAYSILDHAYGELRERDSFDPEVLSIIYLMTAFSQGRIVSAALFSWIATFGRHLLHYSSMNIEIRAVQKETDPAEQPAYEVLVNPLRQLPRRLGFLRLLPALIMHAAAGDAANIQGTLLDQVRRMTSNHGDVIEGFDQVKQGMPIRFQPYPGDSWSRFGARQAGDRT